VADRREALKKSSPGRDASPDAKTKLGTLAGICASINSPVLSWLTRLAAEQSGGILADEMGLCKTVADASRFFAPTRAMALRSSSARHRLVTNWENEVRKFSRPNSRRSCSKGPIAPPVQFDRRRRTWS